MKPTEPRFFYNWSKSDLEKECARLNQVIVDAVEIAEKALRLNK